MNEPNNGDYYDGNDSKEDKYMIDYKQLSNNHYISPPLNLGLYPKVSQGIALSDPFISQVSQMQILQNKFNELKSQRKTENYFINQYLQGDYTKFLKYPQIAIVKQKPPTHRDQIINQILKLRGFNPDGSYIWSKMQSSQNKEGNLKTELENDVKEVVKEINERISTPKQNIKPERVFELQGEFFQVRNRMSNIRNAMNDIKVSFSRQIKDYEHKQNNLLKNLMNVINLGGSKRLQAITNNVYNNQNSTQFNYNEIKEETPKYYKDCVELIDKKLKENELNRNNTPLSPKSKDGNKSSKSKQNKNSKKKKKTDEEVSLPPIETNINIKNNKPRRRKKKKATI